MDGDRVVGGRAKLLSDGRWVRRCGRSQITYFGKFVLSFLNISRAFLLA